MTITERILQHVEHTRADLEARHARAEFVSAMLEAFFARESDDVFDDDVSGAWVSIPFVLDGPELATVSMCLRGDRKHSDLVRRLVKAWGVRADLEATDSGKLAVVRIPDPDSPQRYVRVNVYGYLPESCRLVREDVREPAPDVEIIDGRAYRTITRNRVVCGPSEGGAE